MVYAFNLDYFFEFSESRFLNAVNSTPFKEKIENAFTNNNFANNKNKENYIIDIDPKGWNMTLPSKNVYASILEIRKVDFNIKALDLDDSNWKDGISKNSNIILLNNNFYNRTLLKNCKGIEVGGNYKEVLNIEIINEKYIHMYLYDNSNLSEFKFPNNIKLIY